MKYSTPQIVEVANATKAIQNRQEDKGVMTVLDSFTHQNDATIGAYEADE